MKVCDFLQLLSTDVTLTFTVNIGGLWWHSSPVTVSNIETRFLNLEIECIFLGDYDDDYNIKIQLKDGATL